MNNNKKPLYQRAYEASENLSEISAHMYIQSLKAHKNAEIDNNHPFIKVSKYLGAVGGGVTGAVLCGYIGLASVVFLPTTPATAFGVAAAAVGGVYFAKVGYDTCKDLSISVLNVSRILSSIGLEKMSEQLKAWATVADPQTSYEDANGQFIIPPRSNYLTQNRFGPMKNVTPGQEGQDYPGDPTPEPVFKNFGDRVFVYSV